MSAHYKRLTLGGVHELKPGDIVVKIARAIGINPRQHVLRTIEVTETTGRVLITHPHDGHGDATCLPCESQNTTENGVCVECGGAVLSSGEHVEPERHTPGWAARHNHPTETDEQIGESRG